MSIMQYEHVYYWLIMRVKILGITVEYFLRDLREDISRDVIVARVTEFSEVIDMALKVEQAQLKILNENKAAFVVRGGQWRQGD